MRVVICPDKYAGTISAVDAAAAIADGWCTVAPGDRLTRRPLADGGPGFLDVLQLATAGRRLPVPTTDPLGRPVPGSVLLVGDAPGAEGRGAEGRGAEGRGALGSGGPTAYLESAQACGLHLLAEDERDPKATTSYGLGILLAAAVETGAREVVVGLGGSATNDAGAGMLAALGAAVLDDAGYALPYGGAALAAAAALAGPPRLRQVSLVAATDVDNPLLGLHGASAVFGPQKGATRSDVLLLDAALERFSQVLERDLPTCPAGLPALPGGGAAGGLGAALLALGGRCESGIGLVRRLTGLDAALDEADLVVTGEGAFDEQSLRGKVVSGVADAARERGLPCVVVAGRVAIGRQPAAEAGVTETHSLVEHFGDPARAMRSPVEGLRAIGARLARRWSRRAGGAGPAGREV